MVHSRHAVTKPSWWWGWVHYIYFECNQWKKKWKKSFSQTLTSTKVQNTYFRFIRDIWTFFIKYKTLVTKQFSFFNGQTKWYWSYFDNLRIIPCDFSLLVLIIDLFESNIQPLGISYSQSTVCGILWFVILQQ